VLHSADVYCTSPGTSQPNQLGTSKKSQLTNEFANCRILEDIVVTKRLLFLFGTSLESAAILQFYFIPMLLHNRAKNIVCHEEGQATYLDPGRQSAKMCTLGGGLYNKNQSFIFGGTGSVSEAREYPVIERRQ
jgi:hypothetical protein